MKYSVLSILILLPLLLTGCLEQLSTTRVPGGAARNFFYYLTLDQQANANTYWAPGLVPPDGAQQVADTAQALKGYEVEIGKSTAEADGNGTMWVTLRGRVRALADSEWKEQVLMRASLIETGPGWRITGFIPFTSPEP